MRKEPTCRQAQYLPDPQMFLHLWKMPAAALNYDCWRRLFANILELVWRSQTSKELDACSALAASRHVQERHIDAQSQFRLQVIVTYRAYQVQKMKNEAKIK